MTFLCAEGVNIKKPGIYQIINILNGKFYIGSCGDKQGFKARFLNHRWRLRVGRHPNRHLQGAFNIHGEKNFLFICLMNTEKSRLLKIEQYFLDNCRPFDPLIGYNIEPTSINFKYRENLGNKIKQDNSKKKYQFLDPKNEIIEVVGIRKFCRDRGFNFRSFQQMAIGGTDSCYGWRLYKGFIPQYKARQRNPNRIKKEINYRFNKIPIFYDLICPEGIRYTGNNLTKFCREMGLNRTSMNNLILYKNKNRDGWRLFEEIK